MHFLIGDLSEVVLVLICGGIALLFSLTATPAGAALRRARRKAACQHEWRVLERVIAKPLAQTEDSMDPMFNPTPERRALAQGETTLILACSKCPAREREVVIGIAEDPNKPKLAAVHPLRPKGSA